MSFPLTPERVAAIYTCLRSFPPFNRWRLPPAHEVEFRTPNREDIRGEHINYDPHVITISKATNGHFDSIQIALAHEMIHVAQAVAKERINHGASFSRRARAVCHRFGWDHKAL